MHTVTELVIAAVVLTSWVWMMSLLAFKYGSEILRRKASMKPVARVEYTGEGNDFDVLDLDGRFLYGVTLPDQFCACTNPDGTVPSAALDYLNERAIERYSYPTPVR